MQYIKKYKFYLGSLFLFVVISNYFYSSYVFKHGSYIKCYSGEKKILEKSVFGWSVKKYFPPSEISLRSTSITSIEAVGTDGQLVLIMNSDCIIFYNME